MGEFSSGDFSSTSHEKRFDLVYSLGFIEHFTDFEQIILRHAELVGPGGYLFVSAPNFRGFIQRWLHRFLDKENLDRHHLPAMDPERWAEILRGNGFDVLFAGHYGKLAFWVEPGDRRSWAKSLLARIVARVFWNLKKVHEGDSRYYSAFCGVVAVRRVGG